MADLKSVNNMSFSASGRVELNYIVSVTCDTGFALHGFTSWRCNESSTWEAVGVFSNATLSDVSVNPETLDTDTMPYCVGEFPGGSDFVEQISFLFRRPKSPQV